MSDCYPIVPHDPSRHFAEVARLMSISSRGNVCVTVNTVAVGTICRKTAKFGPRSDFCEAGRVEALV